MSKSWDPIQCSPMHDRLMEIGAIMQRQDGWLMVSHFGEVAAEVEALRSAVGLLDRSFLTKYQIQGKDLLSLAIDLLGLEAPPVGHLVETSETYVARLSRYRMVVIFKKRDAPDFSQVLGRDFDSDCVHFLERTSGLGILRLCGPRSREVLGRLTSLDLREASFPDLRCASAPVADTAAVLLRRDLSGVLGYEVLFDWYYGEYLWEVTLEAGRKYDIRPVGKLAETEVKKGYGRKT